MAEQQNKPEETYIKFDPYSNAFKFSNSSYSGTDCTAIVQFKSDLLVLGNVDTITYSIFREKVPVRTLGRSMTKGYTAGGHTVAGSIVFVVFDKHPLLDVIERINYVKNPSDRYTSPLATQLPPLDLILLFHNEYGHSSIIRIYGFEFVQEGQVHSIKDIYSENVMEYVARDIDVMISYDKLKDFSNMLFERQTQGLFIDNYLGSLLEYKRRLEGEIQAINGGLTAIDAHLSKKTFNGVYTSGIEGIGIRNPGYNKLITSGKLTNADLTREKDKQTRIKALKEQELNSVNNQIALYEKNIKGWNGNQSGAGVAGYDNLSHAPLSKEFR